MKNDLDLLHSKSLKPWLDFCIALSNLLSIDELRALFSRSPIPNDFYSKNKSCKNWLTRTFS